MTGMNQREPWRDGDIVMVSATAMVGLAAIGAAWFGASGTASAATQAAWLNLAVLGFAVSAAGLCLWLLRVRRAIGERRVALISLTLPEEPAEAQPTRHVSAANTTVSLELVRAAGMDRVHTPACPLVAGKDVMAARVGDGEPCGVCAA